MLRINDIVPDFVAESTHGKINFHDFINNSWAVLFSHPKDFTPVCTTELGYMAKIQEEFKKRDCKILGLSIDSVEDHLSWKKDIEDVANTKLDYPLISDSNLKVAKAFNMLPSDEVANTNRTAITNATVRSVFLIDPEKKIRMMLTYPMTTGRNFDEILRVLDSIQLTSKNKVATPVNWKKGDEVIIIPAVSDNEAKKMFDSFTSVKPYLRYTKLK
ncbi:MAG: peroxiredoxin [Alphaproteobacteria bacterium]